MEKDRRRLTSALVDEQYIRTRRGLASDKSGIMRASRIESQPVIEGQHPSANPIDRDNTGLSTVLTQKPHSAIGNGETRG